MGKASKKSTRTSASPTGLHLLYSTSTKLAYSIAQKYYGGMHYVWCAPRPHADRFEVQNPPSSDPIAIYWRFEQDIQGADTHSALIANSRLGICRGAFAREKQGVITREIRILIDAIVKKAPLTDFKPLLYIIPYAAVKDLARPASMMDRARPTSEEYIIENLPRSSFDVLELVRS
jgi:hypothetical protein